MVYDRERKGAAQLEDYSLAEKLTKEEAELVKGFLTALPQPQSESA